MPKKNEVFKSIALYYTSRIFVIDSQEDFRIDLSFFKNRTKNKQKALLFV